MWAAVFLTPFLLLYLTRIIYRLLSGKCSSEKKLVGKTVIVTGSSAGIGKAAALDFAKRGAKVILACRNEEKAQHVADHIINQSGNGKVFVYKLDTSDLSSVREFAEKFLEKEDRLDVLVNNAGMGGRRSRRLTNDGLELIMATNYYGHFLLTNLLLGRLKRSAPSRIINVSSLAHKMVKEFDTSDLNFEKMSYSSMKAYAQSKLCNILFSLELAEKLKGTGVTCNSCHPGFVYTEIFSKGLTSLTFFNALAFFVAKDEELGAQSTIHLAVSEEVQHISGKYFVDCKINYQSPMSEDKDLAKRLWEASELDVKLMTEERKG